MMAKKKTPKAGPFLSTPRAKATPGKTVKPGGAVLLKKKGLEPIAFEKGALHKALGVPQGEKIPEKKKRAALAGELGPKVKKQATFAFKGALAKGRQTARKGK